MKSYGSDWGVKACEKCQHSLASADIIMAKSVQQGDSTFEVARTVVGWLGALAVWIAVIGAVVYGIVRFIHWAWYQ